MRNESTWPRQEISGKHQTKAEESWERLGQLLGDGQEPSEGEASLVLTLKEENTRSSMEIKSVFPSGSQSRRVKRHRSFGWTTTDVVMKKVFESGNMREAKLLESKPSDSLSKVQ